MRVGISPFGSTRAGSFAVADAAFAGGIDTFWLGEGLLEVEAFPRWSGGMEPYAWLGYLAGRYPGVRVGLGASAIPLRDVQWLAKSAATLDNLTEGNHVLAVAPGFWEREFEYRGVDFATRGTLFEEAVHAILAAFEGREFHGPNLDIPAGGRLSPVPLTPGGPPLWLAGASGTLAKALRLGLPFQARASLPDELVKTTRKWFDNGGGLFGLRVAVEFADAVPDEAVVHLSGSKIVGPPNYVVDQLAAYAEIGVGDISLIPGNDDATSLRTVTGLVADVLPQLGSVVGV